MVLPDKPVTLTADEIAELNKKLSTMRHDVNNNLSLIMAAVELVRLKPDSMDRMISTMSEQPARIGETIAKFSAEFEKVFGIKR